MRRLYLAIALNLVVVLGSALLPARAAEPWEILPPTPAAIPASRSGQAAVNGINIHYAVYGQAQSKGAPVILLHGGLANADYWGNQIKALAPGHMVVVIDTRGRAPSNRDARPFGND